MCAKSLQLCLTLCYSTDCSLPGPSDRGILQTRILEWVVMPSSRESSQPTDQSWVSCVSYIAGVFFTHEATTFKVLIKWLFFFLIFGLLGFHCCVDFSLVGSDWRLLFRCGTRASHCGGFSSCWAWALWHADSSSCGTWAQQMWLPGSREQSQ